MRSRNIERRARHKANRPLPYIAGNDYNSENIPQYFQISINVLEARKLAWSNSESANSYVILVLDQKKHRTSIRRNMEEPFYQECFLFETFVSIRDVQRSVLWMAVMEPRCCAPPRLLGEATVDLGAIWAQPQHQVYHKWAQLSLPRDPSAGPVGFLKVDITITFRGEVRIVMPSLVTGERMEDDLLLPSGGEQQRAIYVITIFEAFGLPNVKQSFGNNERRHGKLPSTFVRVSFSGLTATTAVQHGTTHPTYCEQVSIVEMFPNMSQMIRLEVCTAEGMCNKVLACANLKLAQISHGGENGFLPTFGPSMLHMYGATWAGAFSSNTGEDGPCYRGTLLASLKTIVPYYQQGVRSINVEPVEPIQSDSLGIQEDFCIFCPIFEVSMLDRRVVGKFCGVAVTIADIPGERKPDEGFGAMMEELKKRKLHYTGSLNVIKTQPNYGYLDLPNAFPVLQLAAPLPDFRFRMYRNNMVHGIISNLETALADVERRLVTFEYASAAELTDELNRAVDDAASNILKFLDIMQHSSRSNGGDTLAQYSTELDRKQQELQKEEIEKIYHCMSKRNKDCSTLNLFQAASSNYKDTLPGTRKSVKLLLAEIKSLVQSLRSIVNVTPDGWPDIVMWILNEGSRVAYCKISTADIIHSVIPEQNGRSCGRIQTLFLKPLKCPKHQNTPTTSCYCITGKIELLLWMGLFRQKNAFEVCLPKGYTLKTRQFDMFIKSSTTMVECRAFVYRAKLTNGIERSNTPFVRLHALNSVKETKTMQKTSTPTWNQVLKIERMIFTSRDKLISSPPIALIEVHNLDALEKAELIGRCQIKPVVDERQSYEYAPKLQWYEILKGTERTGKILLSVQILPVQERVLKTTVYSPYGETLYGKEEVLIDAVEPLPAHLIPKTLSYKVDIYWWGLREVNNTKKPCVVMEIDELTIKSDIIAEKKSNCNFPNGRTTQTFESPLNGVYSPPLSFRLYDSSTFGRTLFLGTNIVKNPNKYIVNWLPQTEREASLRSTSIMSSEFCQVNQGLFIKKSNRCLDEMNDYVSSGLLSANSSISQSNVKRSKWRQLFSAKEPKEEEYTLLPVYIKEKGHIKVLRKSPKVKELKDWWLKFFYSQKDNLHEEDRANSPDLITIYDSELELSPEFSKFKDWCSTLKLYNGKKTGIPEKDEQLHCGFLKAGVAIYRWPPPENTVAVNSNGVELNRGFFDEYPVNEPSKYLVRVYMVKGLNLMAKDYSGKSDPYVVISCGKKNLGDRNSYIPNTVDPIFGKMYEFRCTLPEEYQLTISLYDFEAISQDELIGSTVIDLENRIYSKHRARVGLSSVYTPTGPNRWRDVLTPSAILEELCTKNHIPAPMYPDTNSVLVNGIEYRDDGQDGCYNSNSEIKENICLTILHNWQTLPICGYWLVPEHVETRTLFNPDKPGSEPGKVQLWVDIFPLETAAKIPPPVDITPRNMESYELRVIVWDVQSSIFNNHDITGKIWKSADIYVNAWIGCTDNAQQTDIHFNSVTGEGNFNWRMIYRFLYQHAERKMIHKVKGPFTEYEEYAEPILIVQLLESDADEFLGSLSLNINHMPRGAKQSRQCSLEALEKAQKINLFTARSIRGWWPLKTLDLNTGIDVPAGVIDLELTLLTNEKSIQMPAGLGRQPPSSLPVPERPTASGITFKKKLTNILSMLCQQQYLAAFVIIVIMIILISYFARSIYLHDPSFPSAAHGWPRREHHKLKHAEGIIRTLYPIIPKNISKHIL